MPSSAEMRAACYVIIKTVHEQTDPMVKRVLAGEAFVLAQRAQLQSWDEAGDAQWRNRSTRAGA